tara:strand:+ start:4206 stop:5042 length:837 start_codon:yes stop_codon:yes gene_type:complete
MKTLLGYAYKDSGIYSKPNMAGYYMGDKQSVPGMQTGGQAMIARAQQMRDDEQAFRKAERQEAKRQRKKSGWGKFGGLLGGLAGAALSPFTGGASLALASGAGSWLGSTLGGRAGGKVKSGGKGTVFLQDRFGDIAKAGKAFDKQQKQQALKSAITTGLTAGFSPGSMYGKVRDASMGRGVAGWGNKLLTDYYKANTPNMASLSLSALPTLGGSKPSIAGYDPSSLFGGSTKDAFALSTPSINAPSYMPSYAGTAAPTLANAPTPSTLDDSWWAMGQK